MNEEDAKAYLEGFVRDYLRNGFTGETSTLRELFDDFTEYLEPLI